LIGMTQIFAEIVELWEASGGPMSRNLALCEAPHKAEFERELIRARTADGRKRAMAAGVKFGRKPKLTIYQKREAIRRRHRGDETLAEIGRSYNVSGWTISRLR
jgi:CENP-B N-terminal DNA-binding domain